MSSDFTSRTARVPTRHYKRRFTISEHAVERFRERVDEEFRHRDDNDLANLLDERLSYAEHTYQVHDPRAPQAVTTLHSVACRHATYYAVMRHDTAITLLDEHMAHNNFDPWTPVEVTPNGLKILTPPPRLPIVTAPPVMDDPPPPPVAPPVEDGPLAVVDDPPPQAPFEDQLAEAGVAYARTRRQQHACEEAVTRLKLESDRAAEALLEAKRAVEDAHRRLIELAEDEAKQ